MMVMEIFILFTMLRCMVLTKNIEKEEVLVSFRHFMLYFHILKASSG